MCVPSVAIRGRFSAMCVVCERGVSERMRVVDVVSITTIVCTSQRPSSHLPILTILAKRVGGPPPLWKEATYTRSLTRGTTNDVVLIGPTSPS